MCGEAATIFLVLHLLLAIAGTRTAKSSLAFHAAVRARGALVVRKGIERVSPRRGTTMQGHLPRGLAYAAVLLPVLAAVAAWLGFRGSDVQLGVDLGTSFSAAAYSDGGGAWIHFGS